MNEEMKMLIDYIIMKLEDHKFIDSIHEFFEDNEVKFYHDDFEILLDDFVDKLLTLKASFK